MRLLLWKGELDRWQRFGSHNTVTVLQSTDWAIISIIEPSPITDDRLAEYSSKHLLDSGDTNGRYLVNTIHWILSSSFRSPIRIDRRPLCGRGNGGDRSLISPVVHQAAVCWTAGTATRRAPHYQCLLERTDSSFRSAWNAGGPW